MNKPFPFAFTLGAIVIVVLYYLFWDTEEPTQENIVEEEISAPIDSSSSVGLIDDERIINAESEPCLLYTSPSPRDGLLSRMPSSA